MPEWQSQEPTPLPAPAPARRPPIAYFDGYTAESLDEEVRPLGAGYSVRVCRYWYPLLTDTERAKLHKAKTREPGRPSLVSKDGPLRGRGCGVTAGAAPHRRPLRRRPPAAGRTPRPPRGRGRRGWGGGTCWSGLGFRGEINPPARVEPVIVVMSVNRFGCVWFLRLSPSIERCMLLVFCFRVVSLWI